MAKPPLRIDTLTHDEATRRNAPTAELEAFVPAEVKAPIAVAYQRRNPDLDPQLVWRGKDAADWSDLIVDAPPLYIQEKVHPKALIEGLRRYRPSVVGERSSVSGDRDADDPQADNRSPTPDDPQADLFADFNGIPPDARTEFYAHDQHWSNRMILGDGLKEMASLAEREGLKGKVQCIYIDPPYGIKFNSNFQWSTTSTVVKDGRADHLTREPEQVKAFRDTWRDGIHSYLTYLRDRLTVARDLLTESGSVFVQIGDENVHRVRALMDEVFGDENFISQIAFRTKIPLNPLYVGNLVDHIVFYAKDASKLKFRRMFVNRDLDGSTFNYVGLEDGRVLTEREAGGQGADRRFTSLDYMASGYTPSCHYDFYFNGKRLSPRGTNSWKTTPLGTQRAIYADRLVTFGKVPRFKQYFADYPVMEMPNFWGDTQGASGKSYVVQTASKVIERCILMTTDPGDLVLDPTCGSGTTAFVAEQWGRRWITIDTSRVALALARARIMGARYPWYVLADTREGQLKEGEVTRAVPADTPTYGRLRQGFVYRRVPHITLGSIAKNAEIDTIWAAYQARLEPLRLGINQALGTDWAEWQMPRRSSVIGDRSSKEGVTDHRSPITDDTAAHRSPITADTPAHRSPITDDTAAHRSPITDDTAAHRSPTTDDPTAALLARWWETRIARQREIDASIAAKAETEYLYDQPYEDRTRVRVAGPFTVESLSPHRVPAIDVDDSLFDELEAAEGRYRGSSVNGDRSSVGATDHRSPTTDLPHERTDFAEMVLENLRKSGVQQAHKADRLVFASLKPWPGRFVCAEGVVRQAPSDDGGAATEITRRAAILVGPEYGTVARADLTAAAREAMEAGFDLLIAAAFNFDAHASEFDRMGALTVLQARINPDLHMPDLATGGAGNLFTVFGEPDICVHDEGDGCASRSRSPGSTCTRAGRSRAAAPTRSRCGSWIRTTTTKASSSATPISRARTTRTRR